MIDFSKIDEEDKAHFLKVLAKQNIDLQYLADNGQTPKINFKIKLDKKKSKRQRKNFLKENIKNLEKIEADVKTRRRKERKKRVIQRVKKKRLKAMVVKEVKDYTKNLDRRRIKKRNNIHNSSKIEEIMEKIFDPENIEYESRNADLMSVDRFSDLLEGGDYKYEDEIMKLSKFEQEEVDCLSGELKKFKFGDLEISQYKENRNICFDNCTFGEVVAVNESHDSYYQTNQWNR